SFAGAGVCLLCAMAKNENRLGAKTRERTNFFSIAYVLDLFFRCPECLMSRAGLRFDFFYLKERPPTGGPVLEPIDSLTSGFFQLLRVHVKIRIDLLHVVMIFERLEQANHL